MEGEASAKARRRQVHRLGGHGGAPSTRARLQIPIRRSLRLPATGEFTGSATLEAPVASAVDHSRLLAGRFPRNGGREPTCQLLVDMFPGPSGSKWLGRTRAPIVGSGGWVGWAAPVEPAHKPSFSRTVRPSIRASKGFWKTTASAVSWARTASAASSEKAVKNVRMPG